MIYDNIMYIVTFFQYGLSFIHILEPEDIHKPSPVPSTSIPSRLLQFDTFSSDEEEFKPGHFFALSQNEKTNDTGEKILFTMFLWIKTCNLL